jgi:hypothetical protein
MKTTIFWKRIPSAIGTAILGCVGGALLAAVGNLISSSTIGIVAAIIVATLLGAVAGKLSGAVIGAMYGGLAAAFGSVIGGTAIGATLTIVACGLLAGWLDWTLKDRNERQASESTPGPFRLNFALVPAARPQAGPLTKELTSCR